MMGVTARWWLLLIVLTLFAGAAFVYGEPEGFSVSCPLTATDQEAQEGYFNCGSELMVATKPGSPVHDDLLRMRGRDVVVVVEAP